MITCCFCYFLYFCWFCSSGTVPFILAAAEIMFMFSLTTSVSVFHTWYSLNRLQVFLLMTMYYCANVRVRRKINSYFFVSCFLLPPLIYSVMHCMDSGRWCPVFSTLFSGSCFLDPVFRPLFICFCFPCMGEIQILSVPWLPQKQTDKYSSSEYYDLHFISKQVLYCMCHNGLECN